MIHSPSVSLDMNSKASSKAEIQIWPFHRAPKTLRQTVSVASEWLVLIPATLVSNTIESLFWRWHDEAHPVIRRVLPDGSVLLAGSYPSAATMISGAALTNPRIAAVKPAAKPAAKTR